MKGKDMDFANWLCKNRGVAGLTRKQLADKLSVNEATIKRWETGETIPPRRGQVVFLEDIQEAVTIMANDAFARSGLKERTKGGKS